MILTGKNNFTGTVDDSDVAHFVDVSDQTDDPAGSSFKITMLKLSEYMSVKIPTIYSANGELPGDRVVDLKTYKLKYTSTNNTTTDVEIDNTDNVNGQSRLLFKNADVIKGGINYQHNASVLTLFSSTVDLQVGTTAGNNYKFITSGTEKMRLTPTGDLYIGLTGGSARVHAKGSTSDTLAYIIKLVNFGDSPLLYGNNFGNFAIGSSAPDAEAALLLRQYYSDKPAFIVRNIADGADRLKIGLTADQDVFFDTLNAEYYWRRSTTKIMSLNSYGLGVGSANAPNGTKLYIKSTTSDDTTFGIEMVNSSDVTTFKGRSDGYVILKANNAAISDSSLANSQMSMYIDEGTDKVYLKARYSTATVKIAELGTFI